jgi:hypothetical protein
MFVSNRLQTRYQDCGGLPVTYYRDFLEDVRDRTGRMLDGGQVFSVCRLALQCQAQAVRFAPTLA